MRERERWRETVTKTERGCSRFSLLPELKAEVKGTRGRVHQQHAPCAWTLMGLFQTHQQTVLTSLNFTEWVSRQKLTQHTQIELHWKAPASNKDLLTHTASLTLNHHHYWVKTSIIRLCLVDVLPAFVGPGRLCALWKCWCKNVRVCVWRRCSIRGTKRRRSHRGSMWFWNWSLAAVRYPCQSAADTWTGMLAPCQRGEEEEEEAVMAICAGRSPVTHTASGPRSLMSQVVEWRDKVVRGAASSCASICKTSLRAEPRALIYER